MMAVIITVGEILVEMMAKEIGQGFTTPGHFIGPYPSGAPAIFIDQAARMGASCGMIGTIGDDEFGRLNVRRLSEDGVDVSQISVIRGATTGTAFVAYDESGGRKFIFHFAQSAAGALGPEHVDEEYIREARYLHIMGCSLSASESMREAVLKAVRAAQKHGVKLSFDPNIRPELLGHAHVKDVFETILSVCDVLLTGEQEALQVTGCATLEQAVSAFRSKGVPLIAVKNGSRGAQVYTQAEELSFPPYPVKEVDPTGAGDCFDGAFIACLAEDESIEQAAKIASAAGALGVTRKGPMEGAFFKHDILRFIHNPEEFFNE
jgi:sugar/nucleoside kinase (ribokinase family)